MRKLWLPSRDSESDQWCNHESISYIQTEITFLYISVALREYAHLFVRFLGTRVGLRVGMIKRHVLLYNDLGHRSINKEFLSKRQLIFLQEHICMAADTKAKLM